MAGFGYEGYEGRVPCPHCGSRDCCGLRNGRLICCYTQKIVTDEQLRKVVEGITLDRGKYGQA